MYDDTDWCLACDCHFDGPGPYCSVECRDSVEQPLIDDLDDEVIYHRIFDAPHSQWTGNGAAGIMAWASEIPPSTSPASAPSSPSRARLPKLLQSYAYCRPAPPALGVTTPPTIIPSPTFPIATTPQQQQSTFCSSLSLNSLGKQSLLSALTESSLATPASTLPLGVPPTTKSSFFGTLATHVRSWVTPSSPLVASSPVATRDLSNFSSTLAKQHDSHTKFPLLAQRHIDGPETAWRLQTTILVAEPRSRGRNPSRT